MSRVDEALRRAAEQAAANPLEPASSLPLTSDDPTALAREPFPIELRPGQTTDDRTAAAREPFPIELRSEKVIDDPAALAREPFPVELRSGQTSDDRTAAAREPFPIDLRPEKGVDDPAALTREPFPVQLRSGKTDVKPSTPKERAVSPSDAINDVSTSDELFDRFDKKLTEKLVLDPRMMAVSREQYRRLAAVLHDGQATTDLKVVMIASAVAEEGKTLTASNLALTLSESYRKRVLLVDADLRRPTLHEVFRLAVSSGLSDGLDPTSRGQKLVVRQILPNLAVLPAGRPISDPMARLISERMRLLINEAKENFDWVIIDAPPLMLLPDAHLLASMVDGAVLVVKAGSTPHHLIKRATDAIGKTRMLGVVLNRTATAPAGAYDQYYHYYAGEPASLTTR